ncbi:ATP-binding protein [Microvenator marinus]|uniref:ATP-binding protein n=1 Tax=Microvenator marinus TaxID=2600177 RepID=A0A5B8XMW6_9DELT|nr:ATP-binding protein [Microvenator marinus]QED26970.1 ATP-binding protein [Microvenator marinus]
MENTFEKLGYFYLGNHEHDQILLDSRNLLTHAVCVGMTGSGKTGLCVGLLEEAAIDQIPAIAIDPKGDIANLMLMFPELSPEEFLPWMDAGEAQRKGISTLELAKQKAELWKNGLEASGQGAERIKRLRTNAEVSVYTPGASAGLEVSLLTSFEAPNPSERENRELVADRVESTVSSVLGLLGVEADPMQSPEHVFLSQVFLQAWAKGQNLSLVGLIRALQTPPFETLGVMSVDDVLAPRSRTALAMKLNNLVASPAFASWMSGEPLNVEKMLYTADGKPRISIFSINHLSDAERMFFVTILLDRVLGWARTQPGTSSLRALLYMDEVFGYLPPVANPPSKKPLLTMLKQARAHGLGLVLATQNPADLDYKALSNAGTWFLGRLQTDRDIARITEGLEGGVNFDREAIQTQLRGLESRQFILHSVHHEAARLFKTRWVLSYLKGPMTRQDIQALNQSKSGKELEHVASEPSQSVSTSPSGHFLPIRVPQPAGSELVWRPMAYGYGRAQNRIFAAITGIGSGPLAVDWSNATEVGFTPEIFKPDPDQEGEFLEIEDRLLNKTAWAEWEKSFETILRQRGGTQEFKCPTLKLKSNAGESAESFYQRVNLELRERRDEAMNKLRASYDKKIERERDQVERAKDALEKQELMLREAQVKGAMSVGGSLLKAFTGRSMMSTAKKGANQAMKIQRKSRDVEQARHKLESEMSDVLEAQARLEAELRELAEKWEPSEHPVESIAIELKKGDSETHFVGVLWVGYWVMDGKRMRAF